MWIIRYGSILNLPRNFLSNKSEVLKDLLNCSLCLGFWCGAFIGVSLYFLHENNTYYFILPLASSAACWFFDSLLDLIQLNCTFLDKK